MFVLCEINSFCTALFYLLFSSLAVNCFQLFTAEMVYVICVEASVQVLASVIHYY